LQLNRVTPDEGAAAYLLRRLHCAGSPPNSLARFSALNSLGNSKFCVTATVLENVPILKRGENNNRQRIRMKTQPIRHRKSGQNKQGTRYALTGIANVCF